MKKTKSEKIFTIINYIVMILVVLLIIYPLWYIVLVSISNYSDVIEGKILLLPKSINFAAYKQAFAQPYIWTSYLNTIFYSVFGTLFGLALTVCGSYALSKQTLPGMKVIMKLVLATMWLNAGMMPTYMLMRDLGLTESRLGIIVFGAVSAYNVVLMKSFFESIPKAMEEAAIIDGASDLRVLLSVYLPLSVPSLMTIGLFLFVGKWNSYYWPMILITEEAKLPLQVLLRQLVVQMSGINQDPNMDFSVTSKDTIVYATIVISALPMLLVYPFIQKFFIKGIMIGAVKG